MHHLCFRSARVGDTASQRRAAIPNSHEQTGLLPVQAMRTLTATPAMRAVAARAAEDELIASIEREERVKAKAERKAAQATRATRAKARPVGVMSSVRPTADVAGPGPDFRTGP